MAPTERSAIEMDKYSTVSIQSNTHTHTHRTHTRTHNLEIAIEVVTFRHVLSLWWLSFRHWTFSQTNVVTDNVYDNVSRLPRAPTLRRRSHSSKDFSCLSVCLSCYLFF